MKKKCLSILDSLSHYQFVRCFSAPDADEQVLIAFDIISQLVCFLALKDLDFQGFVNGNGSRIFISETFFRWKWIQGLDYLGLFFYYVFFWDFVYLRIFCFSKEILVLIFIVVLFFEMLVQEFKYLPVIVFQGLIGFVCLWTFQNLVGKFGSYFLC